MRQEAEQRQRYTFLTNLIDKSSMLKQKCLKMKPRDSLSELELNISRLMELKPLDTTSAELRDHVLDFYQRIAIGQLKQLIKAEENSKKLENDWQVSCDALIQEQ